MCSICAACVYVWQLLRVSIIFIIIIIISYPFIVGGGFGDRVNKVFAVSQHALKYCIQVNCCALTYEYVFTKTKKSTRYFIYF